MTQHWRVLIVDDDKDIHHVTEMALHELEILGRSLEFHHAHSASQADQILLNDRDFAAIVLDVVMERPDAGLQLAVRIRETYEMSLCRIILRTGQPGQAPESEVMKNYDINEYIAKSTSEQNLNERWRLAMRSAIKSYSQLEQLDRISRGMAKVLECTNALLETSRLEVMAKMLANHIPSIFGPRAEFAFCYAGKSIRVGMIGLTALATTPNWKDLTRLDEDDAFTLREKDQSTWKKLQETLSSTKNQSFERTLLHYDAIEPTREIVQCIEFEEVPDLATMEIAKALFNSVRVCATRLIMLRDRLHESTVSVGIVAHEFRTPMASMRMNLEYVQQAVEGEAPLNKKKLSTVVGKTLKIVDSMTDHIDRTMSNVNVVFTDNYLLPLVDVDVCALTREVLDTYQSYFVQVGPPELRAPDRLVVTADQSELAKVLLNLLSNAVKAILRKSTPTPTPAIIVTIDAQDGKAILQVQDFGVGMSQKESTKIFEPFISAHQEPSHGLGLTMVKKAISAMGGDVRCESELGVGTTFSIQLALST